MIEDIKKENSSVSAKDTAAPAENRLLTFWLPALGIGLVVAALAGVVAYYYLLPYEDNGSNVNVWHKKKAAVTTTVISTTAATDSQLNADLKAVDSKISTLDSAASASSSSINDQQTNINLNNF